MKDTKRRFEAFSFFDYTGIAMHLSKMAEKDWLRFNMMDMLGRKEAKSHYCWDSS